VPKNKKALDLGVQGSALHINLESRFIICKILYRNSKELSNLVLARGYSLKAWVRCNDLREPERPVYLVVEKVSDGKERSCVRRQVRPRGRARRGQGKRKKVRMNAIQGQMEEDGFRRFLKRKGEKAHVVENLIGQVEAFGAYLARERGKGLETAEAQDLQAYAAALDARKAGEARKQVRGLILYYQFAGNAAMASLAGGIRERAVAKTRTPFALKDFRGVDQEHVARLKAAGIANVEHMLDAGSTPEARQRLADQTGVPPDAVLELVKLSDLSRIPGVKGVRARLYYDAGADTPQQLAQWDPEALRTMLIAFVERTGFDGIAPLPKEVEHTVATARQLPRIVEYIEMDRAWPKTVEGGFVVGDSSP